MVEPAKRFPLWRESVNDDQVLSSLAGGEK